MHTTKTVVLGVTGGIAAYKALDLVSKLKKAGIDVHCIMSDSSTKFVSPLSFQSLSQNLVSIDMFSEPKAFEIQHISLAKKADLFAVVPATANIIGKVANGIADDLLTTTIMATKAPVVFSPAMNTNMYSNPIVKNNINKLMDYGYSFINPSYGRLACGDLGEGKLADVDVICETLLSMLYDKKDLTGKKVLVTAGPTIAAIDPVRYITNRSSGKMGYAIAKEARDRGAEVILVSGPTSLKPPLGMKIINIKTNGEMLKAVEANFEKADIVIKAAAVADYKPKQYSDMKIKKADDQLSILFTKDSDILKTLGSMKKHQILVGFAAESNDVIENATGKLQRKNLDYIVANDITSSETGFATDENKVTILCRDGRVIPIAKTSKRQVARNLFDIINT